MGSPRSSVSMSAASLSDDEEDMITVRAHNRRTGEITIMRVRKGTPIRDVMSKYAESKGVRAERLSWKRRSSVRESVVVAGTIKRTEPPVQECVDCGCTGIVG